MSDGMDLEEQMEHDMPFKPTVELQPGQDPKAWPVWKKMYASAVFMMMVFVNSYGSGVYSPGIDSMRKDIKMSREVGDLGTSMCMFGMGVGSLLWGPMSQVVGRRPVFFFSMLGLTLFNLGVCLSRNTAGIMICRFFGGACGVSTFSNVAASIIDLTTERERIPYNTMLRYFIFIAPPTSALLGAVVVKESTWEWNLRCLPIASFVALTLYTLTVPETYVPVLIQQDVEKDVEMHEDMKRHRSWLNRSARHLWHKIPSWRFLYTLGVKVVSSIPGPWIMLFEEPLIILITFYTSLLYGLLYGSLLFFPSVWGNIRNYTSIQVGYTYFAVIAGFTAAAVIVGFGIQNIEYKRAYDQNKHNPELRIRSGWFSLLTVPIGLFIFAWTAPFPHVHWVGPCIGIFLFSFGMISVFNSWLSYLTDTYTSNAAAVVSINSCIRCSIAGSFPLFTRQMVKGMTFQGAMSLFGGISIPLTAAGIYIAYHGQRIREKSKHAVYG